MGECKRLDFDSEASKNLPGIKSLERIIKEQNKRFRLCFFCRKPTHKVIATSSVEDLSENNLNDVILFPVCKRCNTDEMVTMADELFRKQGTEGNARLFLVKMSQLGNE